MTLSFRIDRYNFIFAVIHSLLVSNDPVQRRIEITYRDGGIEWTDTYLEDEDKMDRLKLHKNWSRPKTSFTKWDVSADGG